MSYRTFFYFVGIFVAGILCIGYRSYKTKESANALNGPKILPIINGPSQITRNLSLPFWLLIFIFTGMMIFAFMQRQIYKLNEKLKNLHTMKSTLLPTTFNVVVRTTSLRANHQTQNKHSNQRTQPQTSILAATTLNLLNYNYLTFYLSNISTETTEAQLKFEIERRCSIKVQKAEIRYFSKQRLKCYALVTVRWAKYLRANVNSEPQQLAQIFCDNLTTRQFLGRMIFVEMAHNQNYPNNNYTRPLRGHQ